MKTRSSPQIIFPEGFDERAAFETSLKGWLQVQIALANDYRYTVYFSDPIRLQHDVDEAVKSAQPCFAEPGLIIVPEVTVQAIQDAVQFLWKQGFFASLKAEQDERVGVGGSAMRILTHVSSTPEHRQGGGRMGDVYVEVELENAHDRVLVEHGYREASRIRQERVRVLADSGATLLLLPQDLVERLGLRITDQKVIVTYADERKEERSVAGGVTIRVGERSMETECVVGAPLSEPLLGQIVLERLDLLVDCAQGKLVPRPESPYLPLLKLK